MDNDTARGKGVVQPPRGETGMVGVVEVIEVSTGGAKNVRPLTGNEAIARGAWEAGVKVAAAYPGTPSTEILETLAEYPAEDLHAQWSTNEKVALDVAIGASFAGRRALAAMKHVGLNVAADAFMSINYIGVNGGLVLAVCDDPGIHSSQNEQDTRIYGVLSSVPVLEPSDAQEALEFTRLAFDMSETFDTPVIVRSTTRLSHTRSPVVLGDRTVPPQRAFIEKPSKNVMIPAHARPRHGLVIERETKLKAYLADAPINRWEEGDTSFGVITAGTCYPYVREVLPDANVLKLGASWPLPDDLLRRYCESVDRIFVVEELEPVIEKEIRALGFQVEGKCFFPRTGELSPELVRAGFEKAGILEPPPLRNTWTPEPLVRPPVLCAGCPHTSSFMAVRASGARVAGDIGCYTLACLDPLRGMDTTVSMGSSIGNAVGMAKAGETKPVVATIGDSTFLHAGIPALINAVYNQANITVLLLDNHITAMTGGQQHPGTGKTLTRRGRAERRLRGAGARGRSQMGAQGRFLRSRRHASGFARRHQFPRRRRADRRPALRARSGQDQGPGFRGGRRAMQRLSGLHESGLPGDYLEQPDRSRAATRCRSMRRFASAARSARRFAPSTASRPLRR